MNEFWSLVKVNLKTTMDASGQLGSSKKKRSAKRQKIATIIATVVLVAIIAFSMGFPSYLLTKQVAGTEEIKLFTGNLVLMTIFFGLAFSVASLPTALFFSGDTDYLLSMPIRPKTLLLTRLVSGFIILFRILAIFILPSLVGSLVADFSLTRMVGGLLSFLTLPIIPACLATIIFLLLLRFIPVSRNKNKMMIFLSILSIGLVFLFNRFMAAETDDLAANGKMVTALMTYYPPFKGAQWMMGAKSLGTFLLGFLMILGPSILALVLTLLVADHTFLYIIKNMAGSGEKKKKLAQEDVTKQLGHSQALLPSFMKREWASLFRNPEVFMNAVMVGLIFVLVFIIGIVSGMVSESGRGMSLAMVRSKAGNFMGQSLSKQFIFAGFAGLVTASFTTGLTGLLSSSISREGKDIRMLKSFPIRGEDLLWGKFLADYLVVLLPLVPIFVVSLVFVPFLPFFHLFFLLVGLVTAFAVGQVSFHLDLSHPKLDWLSIREAVAQNKNRQFSHFGGMALAFIPILLVFVLEIPPIPVLTVLLVLVLALAIGLGVLLNKRAKTVLADL